MGVKIRIHHRGCLGVILCFAAATACERGRSAAAASSRAIAAPTPNPFARSRFEDLPVAATGDICTLYADQSAICQLAVLALGSRGAGPTAAFPIVLDSSALVDPVLRPNALTCGSGCFVEVPSIRSSTSGYDVVVGRQITAFTFLDPVYVPAIGHAQLLPDTPDPGSWTLQSNPLDRSQLVFSQPPGCSAVYLTRLTNDYGAISLSYSSGRAGCQLAAMTNASGDALAITAAPGQWIASRSWDAYTLSLGFDALGELTETTGPFAQDGVLGVDITWTDGRFRAIRPTGVPAERLFYDSTGRVIGLATMSGDAYSIEARNDRVAVGDGTTRRVTTYTVSAGRISEIVLPDGSRTAYTYTAAGLVESVVPDGNAGLAMSYGYNAYGDLTTVSGAFGYRESATYTDYGAITSYQSSYEPAITWTYDGSGFAISAQLANGLVTTFGRDGTGLLTSVGYPTDPPTNETYQYDAFGQLVSQTDTFGRTSSTSYDRLGRLAGYTDYLGGTSRVTRTDSPQGLFTQVTSPYGTTQVTTDLYGRLVRRSLALGGGLAAEQLSMGHEPAGARAIQIGRSGSPLALDLSITHDRLGAADVVRLNGVTIQSGAAAVVTATTAGLSLF